MKNYMKTILNALLLKLETSINEIKMLLSKKADKSDIVQSDWNQNNEDATDYVKNRTHWDSRKVIIHEATYDGNLDNALEHIEPFVKISDKLPNSIEDFLGNPVKANFEGTIQEELMEEGLIMPMEADIAYAIGEVFLVVFQDYNFDGFSFSKGIWTVHDTEASIYGMSISWKENFGELKQIDEKYLPKIASTPDWNQNDPEAKDYIKNRPFYKSIEDKVLYEGVVTNGYSFNPTLDISTEQEYLVIINGKEYVPDNVYYDDTDSAYCITIRDDDLGCNFWIYSIYFTCGYDSGESPDEFDLVVIAKNVEAVCQVPFEYLPDSIVRTDTKQTFANDEKKQARDNIGAIETADIYNNFIWYGTTSWNTQFNRIEVNLINSKNFILEKGVIIRTPPFDSVPMLGSSPMKMKVMNTASKPLVNSSGEHIESRADAPWLTSIYGDPIGETIFFIYDGTNWRHMPFSGLARVDCEGLVKLYDRADSSKNTLNFGSYAATPAAVHHALNDAKSYTDEQVITAVSSPKHHFTLIDDITSYEYIIRMQNGNLTSICKASSLAVTTLPTKTAYTVGETLDLTDMVVTLTRQDGATEEVNNYSYTESDMSAAGTVDVTVSYVEAGETYSATFAVTITEATTTEETETTT